jgi:hypothetical protein
MRELDRAVSDRDEARLLRRLKIAEVRSEMGAGRVDRFGVVFLSAGGESRHEDTSIGDEVLRIGLLGVFSIGASDSVIADDAWRLRKAKTLIKLLDLAPERRLHRRPRWDHRGAGGADGLTGPSWP